MYHNTPSSFNASLVAVCAYSRTLVRTIAAISACSVFLTFPALADSSESCPTWLPDLRCDRQARPAGFVAPMSMPYLFEDPFITTEVQGALVYHEFPKSSVFAGGYAVVIAAQVRIALTDRLGFIATKDGLTIFRPKLAILEDRVDSMDVTVGLKYALIDWRDKNFIFTPSLRYEVDLGEHDLYQGQGNGVFIPAASFAWGLGRFHVIGDLGGQVPIDTDKDSTSLFYNLHLDYVIHEHIVPFIEVNGMHWTKSGNGSARFNTDLGVLSLDQIQAALGLSPFEGADIANLGSSGIAGADLVTMAWGVRVPLNSHVSLGASYERAISNRKDIFEHRLTAMASYVF